MEVSGPSPPHINRQRQRLKPQANDKINTKTIDTTFTICSRVVRKGMIGKHYQTDMETLARTKEVATVSSCSGTGSKA